MVLARKLEEAIEEAMCVEPPTTGAAFSFKFRRAYLTATPSYVNVPLPSSSSFGTRPPPLLGTYFSSDCHPSIPLSRPPSMLLYMSLRVSCILRKKGLLQKQQQQQQWSQGCNPRSITCFIRCMIPYDTWLRERESPYQHGFPRCCSSFAPSFARDG